ncbi:MFS transporter [Amylostereum chailletii]|nr:MFS transporter [Amylostereum chailletii]
MASTPTLLRTPSETTLDEHGHPPPPKPRSPLIGQSDRDRRNTHPYEGYPSHASTTLSVPLSHNTLPDPEIEAGRVDLEKAKARAQAHAGRKNYVNEKEDPFEVHLDLKDDPQSLPLFRRWLAVLVISSVGLCVTAASSAGAMTETAIGREFGIAHEAAVLTLSLFVLGLAAGPLLAGPCSEIYGRNAVYRVSFVLFFAGNFGVAFAPNFGCHLAFRFITGCCGSAFLSVAGGSVSDLFPKAEVPTPMAVYTISPFLGPEVGMVYSGFVNQHLSWRWTYYIVIMWSFVQLVALFVFVPETYTPVLLRRKAASLRACTGDQRYSAPREHDRPSLAKLLVHACWTPVQLVAQERMVFFIDLWNALILGILYLLFQAFPIVFGEVHGFAMEMVGLSFLGIAIGMLLGLATQPLWNERARRYRDKHGDPPPEFDLVMGELGGVLVSASLYWIAFTTYRFVHWSGPLIGSVPFGAGTYFVFTSSFTYLVTAYRPLAASALASDTAMRCAFAAGFPLFAGPMYRRLGTVGATALLAGLTTVMAPLPFIFHKYGAQLRARSKFAVAE